MAKDDVAEIKKEIDRVTKQIGELTKALGDLQKKLKDREVGPKVLAPMEKKLKTVADAFDAMKKGSSGKRAAPGTPSAPAPIM